MNSQLTRTKPVHGKPNEPAPIPLDVQWRMIDAVFFERKTLLSAAVVMVAVTVVGTVTEHAPELCIWAIAGGLLQALRLRLADAYVMRPASDPPDLWARRFTYGAWTLGALWGLLGIVVDLPVDAFLKFLLITTQAAFVMGGAVRSNTVLKAVNGQIILTLGPLFIACLFSFKLDYTLFSVMVLLHILAAREIAQTLHARSLRLLLAEAAARQANDRLSELNDRLEILATTDGLTGITNRRGFDLLLEHEWQQAHQSRQPIAMLLFDIDYFKRLNDNLGHLAGDDCLRRIAACLRQGLPHTANILARYGGEEFVVILGNTDRKEAFRVADKLRQDVADIAVPNPETPAKIVTVSVGVAAIIPISAEIAEALLVLDVADQALYFAKQRGRNQVSDRMRAAG